VLTRELVRAQRTRAAIARAPARPRPPTPRYVPPDVIEGRYAARLRGLVAATARAAYAPLLARLPELVADARAARGDAAELPLDRFRLDAPSLTASATATVRDAEATMRDSLRTRSKPETERASTDVDDHNKVQLGRQVKAVAGIDLAGSAKLRPIIERFVRDNVALITGLSARLAREVEELVIDGLARGRLHESLARDIERRLQVSESRAQLIAVDQVQKLNGQLNAQRQQDLGVTHFYWRTSEDERVRGNPGGKYPRANPSHWARRNQRYAYADPPKGKNGEPELPGTPIRCRCTAEPDLEQLSAANDNSRESDLAPPLDPDVEADALAQLAALEAGEALAPVVPFDAGEVRRMIDEARLAAEAAAPPPPPPPPPPQPPGGSPPSSSSPALSTGERQALAAYAGASTSSAAAPVGLAAVAAHDGHPTVHQLATSPYGTKVRMKDAGEKEGANETWKVTFHNPDGSTTTGVWKPTPKKGLRSNIDPATEPQRERAASLLADQLGVRDLYPRATLREIDGQPGSVQEWAKADKTPKAALDAAAMDRMRVFDFIIGNTDRHAGNVLWRGGTPVLIDHTLSFPSGPPDTFRQPYRAPAGRLSDDLLRRIDAIDEGAVVDTLRSAGIDEVAIRYTLYRLRALKNDPQALASTGDYADIDRWETKMLTARGSLSADERDEIDDLLRLRKRKP
jgi:SPP1 gp7 family putative phage head morphogenesis protein